MSRKALRSDIQNLAMREIETVLETLEFGRVRILAVFEHGGLGIYKDRNFWFISYLRSSSDISAASFVDWFTSAMESFQLFFVFLLDSGVRKSSLAISKCIYCFYVFNMSPISGSLVH